MSKFGLIHVFQFLLFLALQILLMPGLVLFDTGFCFIYVAFLLFLPIEVPAVLLLFLGFITGITIDIFYDTGGIHAAASVLLCFLRPFVLKLLTPRDGYESNDTINIHVMGWRWFLTYTFLLVFMHHLLLFFLELGSIRMVGFTMAKVLFSTLFTGVVIFIIQLLFFSVRRATR
ncbi:MAG: hypothetical protein LPJ89_10705 [Hymenobacteraceae bacterium]|nr:hypothetical protein [Hymenobacteraceae bacterium]MDX5396677.1 hypothetical protein [Hymenobacteraceae bacterium]MDX5444237.1 hypothetical protein [Hymenobacteraceae bacterium]MDX5512740.1 hypothetical protein [Hymenobacteraceae bacterium]